MSTDLSTPAIGAIAAENIRLAAELAITRRALEPFASAANFYEVESQANEDAQLLIRSGTGFASALTVRDFRHAQRTIRREASSPVFGDAGALASRARVAAEYRVAGSPHEWTDEDALAMARFILAGPKPAPDLAGQGEPVAADALQRIYSQFIVNRGDLSDSEALEAIRHVCEQACQGDGR